MSLDLNEVKAAQARVYAEVSVYEKGDAALGFLDSGVVDDLVAEIERLRSVPEPDNHHNAYACPHCEAPIHAVEAERDRYRAEWEEAARHALRWQAEYDTAQQEIERLHFAIDGLAANAAGYQRGEVEQAGQARRAERERDDGRAQVASVEALCEMRDHVSGAPGNGIVATASVMRALRGPETSGAVSTAGTGDAANPRRAGVDAPAPEPEGYYEVCVDPDTARLSAKQGDGS